ncbi:FG-nucleoporin NUP159 [Aspergillus lucknowensis]|uniref:Nucleoporin Nup159/Nup146 N-terminal domain-containing protein n=1 Tax=Aspergillus lucknowensis TaxID=176173 RepID=A0ABR4M2N8_9EURO
MAFRTGISNPAGNIPTELGPELPDLFAEEVGFKGVSSDSNVQLLPTPWPTDALPAPTSTLLAVAATKGIVVGAGPDSLSISPTEAVRAAISADTGKDKVKTKPFQPQATISLPRRPTHIAFAFGDSALVLATEDGPSLSVFETGSLLQPNAQPAISIPTNGATFRFIAPNPAHAEDSHSSLVALVTTGGELLVADLKAGNLLSGPNGNVLKTGVSSICWSNKGKQLVAGLADGSGFQMTPDGTQKDLIPRPPDLTDPCHVSSLAWLENDIFLMVYTPNASEDDMGLTPSSSYYIITRRKQAPFLIQKLPELASPFGFKRAPAYQFICRLRDYKPHLKDALIVSSTASADVGLVTRSDHPLASDDNAKTTVGLFVTTEVNDDAKKASVPLKDSNDETSVIGLGVDLSSSEVVISPIQGEDIDESSTPLPNVLLLNHEGILCSWWFIYSDSIRQKIAYHGLASVSPQQQPALQPQAAPPQRTTQPTFGQPAFGSSASASTSTFGAPAFGKPSAPAFGSPSALGRPQQPSFGQPSFGAPAFGTPAFGTPAALGSVASQLGKSGFGQPPAPGKGLGSLPFAGTGSASGGGFGSFAGGGGFASLTTSKPSEASPFGQPTSSSPFAKTSGPSAFGSQLNNNTAFAPQKTQDTTGGGLGVGSGGFVLGSTFKGDGTAANDATKPEKSSSLFSFGSTLDEMISTPNKTSPPTEAMDDMEDTAAPQQPIPEAKAPAPSLFGAPSKPSAGASVFGSFGSQAQTQQPFGSAQTSKSPFSMFGTTATDNKLPSPSSPPSEKTAIASPPLTQPKSPEPETNPAMLIPEAPLPPDPTSRAVYGPGDTSASSNVSKSSVDDAPLPPDFTALRKSPEPESEPPLPPDFSLKPKEENSQQAEKAPLPPDFTRPSVSLTKEAPPIPDGSDADESEKGSHEADESEFEDSGEDITHELGQPETTASSAKLSPESSFDFKQAEESPGGPLFGRISQPKESGRQQSHQLFGEISKPLFPQPTHASESPRSPSPVRPSRTQQGLPKLENIRSVSAPHKPGSALAARKASLSELAKRENQLRPEPTPDWQPRGQPTIQTQEEPLSDDEDERLRADLNRPLQPVPTLDPFLPHQDYTGQTTKPGIPGQIERLYRDINSMVDTLGINARSLSAFLLYQQDTTKSNLVDTLKGGTPVGVLNEKLFLQQIEDLDDAVAVLVSSLEEQRVQGVEDKLESCREMLGKDILTLRNQCASIRKTLDAHSDTAAIVSAPLSAEQATLQQDLRSSSAEIQAKLADLESAVSLLRAKIADAPRADGSRQPTRRPTVEAVTSTIATMMNMVESKSGDIDVLEVQLKKLGIDTSAAPSSREGSPFATPRTGLGKIPPTPRPRGSIDGPISPYHTPEPTARGVSFRSSVNGSAKGSRLRAAEALGDLGSKRESTQWKAKMQRKQHIMGSLRKAIDEKQSKIRSVDDI